MKKRAGYRRLSVAVVVLLALLAPSGAAAATVVNGDFESGTLAGWHVRQPIFAGNWFAYQGTKAPIGDQRGADHVQPPPQGAYAAISDEANPDSLILYQDIALEPGYSHRLSLIVYYNTYKPIAVPTPDTLSVDEEVLGTRRNQQYRIDVMKPSAPIESLDPADILRTIFRTKPGDPAKLSPTTVTADLSPFAGQTVRLRIANAVHEEVFNAGVDAVSISSAAPGRPPSGGSGHGGPSLFSFGKVKVNRHDGTATLRVRVSGPGLLTAKGIPPSAHAARASKAKKPAKLTKPVTVRVASARTVTIHVKPTPSSRKILRQKHKLRVKVAVAYTPAGGSPETAAVPVMLQLEPRAPRRR